MNAAQLSQQVLDRALELGFDSAGIIPVGSPQHGDRFLAWLAAGYHGDMAYLARRAAERLDPQLLAPGARSMLVVRASYAASPLPSGWNHPAHGRVARYAWTVDYHEAVKAHLYRLDAFIREHSGRKAAGKACVDAAPLMERDFANAAGLGFIGRNTCLITPGSGSWSFLAALLVPEEMAMEVRSAGEPHPGE